MGALVFHKHIFFHKVQSDIPGRLFHWQHSIVNTEISLFNNFQLFNSTKQQKFTCVRIQSICRQQDNATHKLNSVIKFTSIFSSVHKFSSSAEIWKFMGKVLRLQLKRNGLNKEHDKLSSCPTFIKERLKIKSHSED